jgi:hypothetical protein
MYPIGNLLYLVKERLASKPEANALLCFYLKTKHSLLISSMNTSLSAAPSPLSYKEVVELSGIEPLTSCVQGRRSPS